MRVGTKPTTPKPEIRVPGQGTQGDVLAGMLKKVKDSLDKADKAGIVVTLCGKLSPDEIAIVIKSFEDKGRMKCRAVTIKSPDKAVLEFERGEDEDKDGKGA